MNVALSAVDRDRLDILRRLIRLEVEHGPVPSAQFAVAHNGRLVAFETFGDARPDQRYILQSVSRAILGPTMWKLMSDGLLDPAERVGDIVPEFATREKHVVTVEQVLTHTAGFPLAPLGYPAMCDRQARLEAFGRWRLTSPPGEQLEFHLTSAAWVLAEIVERRTGLSFPDYLRERVCAPLGLTIEVGAGLDRQCSVALPVLVDAVAGQEVDPWGPWFVARPEVLAAGEPSHSIVATAADVAMFLQAVESEQGLWKPEAVRAATTVRISQPPTGMYGSAEVVHMALFVAVTNGSGGVYLPVTSSPRTWGHGGAPGQLAFVDPETGLSFAFLTNGYPAAGYDESRAGINRRTLIANLAGDLVR